MEKQKNIKGCKNKLKEPSRGSYKYCCAIFKVNDNRCPPGGCVAHPSFVNGIGHCTNTSYTTVWFGYGPENTDIKTLCPGYNHPKATREEIESYKAQITEGLKDYARKVFKEKGIEQQVI